MRTLALLILLVLPACFMAHGTVNEPLDREVFASLTPGTSTAGDVVAALGAPAEVVQLGRRSAWRYEHSSTKETGLFLLVVFLHGTDTRSDRTWLFFDENEIMTHLGVTLGAGRSEYSLPGLE
ncbi:MAG: hypothetical protein QF724_03715 [Planctomycetota bacterium]|jgi:hypothetical protein|nr:hypothetical protein [Planctomycetota bacterium]MDP6369028.1 hypothetical protein [Planctomycetota bacterium]MDP6519516.1 hypothetical protein [Planctomycetota bacterium]MDP6838021.1 hypothetical protein [Planctomycetota bacterium]